MARGRAFAEARPEGNASLPPSPPCAHASLTSIVHRMAAFSRELVVAKPPAEVLGSVVTNLAEPLYGLGYRLVEQGERGVTFKAGAWRAGLLRAGQRITMAFAGTPQGGTRTYHRRRGTLARGRRFCHPGDRLARRTANPERLPRDRPIAPALLHEQATLQIDVLFRDSASFSARSSSTTSIHCCQKPRDHRAFEQRCVQ